MLADVLRLAALAGAGFACASVLLNCSGNPLPGTQLGTYRVVAALKTNTCGAGLAAPNPWTFDVQLSQQGSTFYWSWLDGNAPLKNTLSGNDVSLTNSQTSNVDSSGDGGAGPCTMQRADTVQVTLGAGSPPSSFQGSIRYTFSVSGGADCSDQLSASGGSYDALPCSVSYTTTATHQ
jgi:hypothetical protein